MEAAARDVQAKGRLQPWSSEDKAGSTPPVVPGAAPALAKARVGGFLCLFTADAWVCVYVSIYLATLNFISIQLYVSIYLKAEANMLDFQRIIALLICATQIKLNIFLSVRFY